MKKILTISIAVLSISYSCQNKPKNLQEFMVDISEFNIDNNVLKDGDEVDILGSSGNLTKDHKIDFYNLVVVKAVATGDTVNVLVTNFYQSKLNKRRTKFMSNSTAVGKILEQAFTDPNALKDGDNIEDLQPKSFDKVFYDSEYIQVDVISYPAITGNLGDFTIEGDLDILQ